MRDHIRPGCRLPRPRVKHFAARSAPKGLRQSAQRWSRATKLGGEPQIEINSEGVESWRGGTAMQFSLSRGRFLCLASDFFEVECDRYAGRSADAFINRRASP